MHDVTIVMMAWNRRPELFDYFRQAVECLKRNLQDWDRVADWLVCVETQNAVCEEEFARFCGEHRLRIVYRPGPAYLGANLNLALVQVRTPCMLYVQDDQRLRGPLTIGYRHVLPTSIHHCPLF
jgi:hypothetical protein